MVLNSNFFISTSLRRPNKSACSKLSGRRSSRPSRTQLATTLLPQRGNTWKNYTENGWRQLELSLKERAMWRSTRRWATTVRALQNGSNLLLVISRQSYRFTSSDQLLVCIINVKSFYRVLLILSLRQNVPKGAIILNSYWYIPAFIYEHDWIIKRWTHF